MYIYIIYVTCTVYISSLGIGIQLVLTLCKSGYDLFVCMVLRDACMVCFTSGKKKGDGNRKCVV